MPIKLSYNKAVIVVHGKCEMQIVNKIKSTLRIPIAIDSNKNGKLNIQLTSLLDRFNNFNYESVERITKKFCLEKKGKNNFNGLIIPIMDLDDATNEQIEKYKNKSMFKDLFFYDKIMPIWNNSNLDEIMLDLKFIDKIPSNRNKGKVYENVVEKIQNEYLDKIIDKDSAIKQMEKLIDLFKSSKDTNMGLLFTYLLEIFKDNI